MQHGHKQQVQRHVQNTGGHQKEHGAAGITHGPQDTRAHVIHHRAQGTRKVNADIGHGVRHAAFRHVHQAQHLTAQAHAQHREHRAQQQRQGNAGMHGVRHPLPVLCSIKLGENHRRAGADADEEAIDHVHQRPGGSHRRQGLSAHQAAHDDGVHGVVHLLEKSAQQDREKEDQQLLPDDALGDLALL